MFKKLSVIDFINCKIKLFNDKFSLELFSRVIRNKKEKLMCAYKLQVRERQ